jgi:hypothetical protein
MFGGAAIGTLYLGQAFPQAAAAAVVVSPISGVRTVVVPLETRTIVVRTE